MGRVFEKRFIREISYTSEYGRKNLRYSYVLERGYYLKNPPKDAAPYLHLGPYFKSWLDVDAAFKGKKVLEIGGGECQHSRYIADFFRPEVVVPVELILERMVPAIRANKNSRLRPIVGDCFRLPVKSNYFGTVFGSLVLHQLPDLREVFIEIKRVLKRGGVYIGIEPNPFWLKQLCRHFFAHHSPNQYLFWPRGFVPMFEEAGFSVRIRFFNARYPFLGTRFLSPCIGIEARQGKS
ncbi:MAG: class I SAM-dependent methyltransferase [Candidatus Brocadiales bacterium]